MTDIMPMPVSISDETSPLASYMASTAECPILPVAQERDTTYFIQFTPFVYDWDPAYYAIHPARLQKAGLTSLTPETVGELRGQLAEDLGPLLKAKTAGEFRPLFSQGGALMVSSWVFGGNPSADPYWGVGIEYAQTWRSLGIKRGRALSSVPLGLYPATKEISVRSWARRTVTSTIAETTERTSSNEISGDEKWSLATKKQVNRENSTSFNPRATVNQVSIPVSGPIPIGVGGDLGISGDFQSKVTRAQESGREFVQSATIKATETLKISRNSTVEESTEVGSETTTKETIANPNRCNTLNYLYYEVLEDLEIITRPVSVGLFLFVPLPVEKVTNAWLLRYECVLRPLVPCEQLRSGFDAAKAQVIDQIVRTTRRARELANQHADNAQAGGLDPGPIADAIARVLDSYHTLSGSSADSGPGSWLYWQFVDKLATDLRDALGVLDEQFSTASDAQKADVAFLTAMLDQFFTTLGSVDDAFNLVDAAVVVATVAGATVGGPVVATVVAVAVGALELFGIDAAPDDERLKSRILELQNKYEAFLAPAPVAAPPAATASAAAGGAAAPTAPSYAEQLQQRLLEEAELRERVEAQVESRRLREHIQEHLPFYYQAIWSSWPDVVVEQVLREAGIAGLVENRFAGFRGYHGAFRVVNEDALKTEQIDITALSTAVLEAATAKDADYTHITTVPTGGVVVEPMLGRCEGGDVFVMQHRDLDLRHRDAEVRTAEQTAQQAVLEVARRQARLDADDLTDPDPDGPTRIEVDLADNRPDR